MTAHHLWFRLDEVIPIVEHAMACPAHRLTEAQTRAGQPLRPALTWTGTPSRDTLHSNGLPDWRDAAGSVHRAWAHTWWQHRTGRYGTANLPGYRTAHLPLTDTPTTRGHIDAIRRAHRDNRHWMRITIDPKDGHLIGPDRIRFARHRDDLVPDTVSWVPATVTCDAVVGAGYPALIADGCTSADGHLLPRFDRETVADLIGDLGTVHHNPCRAGDPTPGAYPRLQHLREGSGDLVAAYEEHDDGLDTVVREVDLYRPDPNGRYSVGAYLWPWRHHRT